MSAERENDDTLDRMLKDAYGAVEPRDSWEGLRNRIDSRLQNKRRTASEEGSRSSKEAVFWRRIALAMAACFTVTAGLLVYMLGFNSGAGSYSQRLREIRSENATLRQSDIARLTAAFSQVQEVFEQQASWIVLSHGNAAEIGVDEKASRPDRKVIVTRLACNYSGRGVSEARYFDVVAVVDQEAQFQLPTPGGVVVISVLPKLRADGIVSLEVEARSNTGSRAEAVSSIANDAFTPLVQVRTNGGWLSIDGAGKALPKI